MARDEQEISRVDADLAELPLYQELVGGSKGNGSQPGAAKPSAQDVGDASLPAEINSLSNPTSSLAGAGNS